MSRGVPDNIGGAFIFYVTRGTEIDCLMVVIKLEGFAMKRVIEIDELRMLG